MQSYKIFYNNAHIFVTKYEQYYQTKINAENCFLFGKKLDWGAIIFRFLVDEQNINLLYNNEIEEKQIKEFLCNFFIFKRAAGGIVFKDNAVLSIFRFDRWDFPKGHIEAGETDTDAALREVAEETGIDELTIEKDLNHTYHIFRDKDQGFVLKETHWFQMRTTSKKPLIPQTEENILAAKWIPFSQQNVIVENTYPTIVDLLERILRES